MHLGQVARLDVLTSLCIARSSAECIHRLSHDSSKPRSTRSYSPPSPPSPCQSRTHLLYIRVFRILPKTSKMIKTNVQFY
ncbi:hypothetical protein C8R44DRAFT_365849 [Mycena epipterygia]|nr:hypothetical protein C8R44DRAFT_365849 [Mycena epipterygia]